MDKLQKIQIELKLSKNMRNDFGKFNYRNCEAMLTEIKDVLSKHNACLKLTNDLISSGDKHFIKTTATYVNLDTNYQQEASAFAAIDFDKKGMDFGQACGAAQTYCTKYSLNSLFLCDDGSLDADAQAPKGYEENKPQQQPNQYKNVDFADIDKCNTIEELTNLYNECIPLLKTDKQKEAFQKKCTHRKNWIKQDRKIYI